mgnify:CR=1 FL=1
MRRPLLALTLGDPAGIGPEIVAALLREGLPRASRLLIVGDRGVLGRAAGPDRDALLPPTVATAAWSRLSRPDSAPAVPLQSIAGSHT